MESQISLIAVAAAVCFFSYRVHRIGNGVPMGSVQGGRQRGEPAGREQSARVVARTLKAKAALLRDSAPSMVLALVAGATLAPIVASAAGIGGIDAAVLTAAGGVGTNAVTELLQRGIERWQRRLGVAPEPAELADTIASDILEVLGGEGGLASDFARQLVLEVEALGGFEAALVSAGGELRGHLAACFGDLRAGQLEMLSTVLDVRHEQRRQRAGLDEAVDRLRLLTGSSVDGPGVTSAVPAFAVSVTTGGARPFAPGRDEGWRAGAEVMIGDRLYLLHSSLLAEQPDAGQLVVLRQAVGRQLVPAPKRDGYAWLRQAAPLHGAAGNAGVRAARQALTRERDLLNQLEDVEGVPAVRQLAADFGRATLAVTWPVSRKGERCQTLGATFPPGSAADRWHLHLLLTGFRGLALTLSKLHERDISHRNLTLDSIIVAGKGRFVLRDLGLAAQTTRRGEGPSGYRAPEQGLAAGRLRPGTVTDVWQLAAITYHVVTGHLPAPRNPVPARALNPVLPEDVSAVLTAALDADTGNRPRMRELRAKLALPSPDVSEPEEERCRSGS